MKRALSWVREGRIGHRSGTATGSGRSTTMTIGLSRLSLSHVRHNKSGRNVINGRFSPGIYYKAVMKQANTVRRV